jgi:hypothetical protein
MPSLRRGDHKEATQKRRVVVGRAASQPASASRPRAYQMPTVNPEPFVPRRKPEPSLSSDLPLWPGWHSDPTGRHETRYFDGVGWTDHVVDSKRPSRDAFTG